MLMGHSYTKAADIWSAGILLYAMTTGRLPFAGSDFQTISMKVVRDDIVYPPLLSRSLVDFLRRLLCKNPDQRITIDRLKEHPWFSQSEYSVLIGFQTSIFYSQPDSAVDRGIIDLMAEYGFDSRDLANAILSGDDSTATVVYKQIRRDRLTTKMKDLHEEMTKLHEPNAMQRFVQRNRPVPSSIAMRPAAKVMRKLVRPKASEWHQDLRQQEPRSGGMSENVKLLGKRPSFEAP
jgi:serine/threonine protein kinase